MKTVYNNTFLDAQANTNVFTQTLESDPEGFKRNIMPKVKGV